MADSVSKVSWADWARLRDQNGWRVKEVIMGDDAETIIVIENPEPVPDERRRISPREGSKLSFTLADVFGMAERAVGTPQRMVLRGGMRVDVIYHLDGRILFQIARKGVYPSDVEWKTTCEHLPFVDVTVKELERFELSKMCYIRGEVVFP